MRLENILSETESLKRILENLSEGIIAHDQTSRGIFFNRSAEEITGYERDEVIGKDCHEVFGAPFCGGRCSFLDGSHDSLDRLSYPLNIFTKKGEARRIEMQVTGMRDQGGSFDNSPEAEDLERIFSTSNRRYAMVFIKHAFPFYLLIAQIFFKLRK